MFALFFAASIISAAESLAGHVPPPSGSWAAFTPATVQEVADAAVAALVAILLSARRGITPRLLGVRLPRGADGRPAPGRAVRMAALGLVAFIIGGLVTSHMATGRFPGQVHPTGPYLLYSVAGALLSAVAEEMVVLAFVVTTLRQAKRPVAEIVVVAVLARCSYHIYYGVGVIGIAVWAAIFVWLFYRFGSVIPLIILHFFWDTTIFLGERWVAAAAVGEFLGLILLAAGLVTWLAGISARRTARHPPPDARDQDGAD